MPKRPDRPALAPDRYWADRLRSKAFRRGLTTLLAEEFASLSGELVKSVVDPARVRAFIAGWEMRMVDRGAVADLVIQVSRGVRARLKRRRESLLDALDAALLDDIDALLDAEIELPPYVVQFVTSLMQQEFVRRLFTDLIFTAIVSFNQRANPLFGALAVRVMEEQIKGFIRLFMPMLQRQAVAFAVDQTNRRISVEFTRSIVRQLLNEPLRHYAAMTSPRQRKQTEALIRNAARSATLDATIREAVLALWDEIYRTIKEQRIGALLRLDQHAGWLAKQCVEMILPLLARPGVLRFIAAEIDLAVTRASPTRAGL